MKRVLFVDDEPNILDGLKRLLRGQRREWEMVFAASGAEALEAVRDKAFDVVVSDMRMPGMNGAELLRAVRELHPDTVRIVLSGQSDAESAMRSVSVSHQFLAKPCEADTLRGTIERACALEKLLQTPDLQEALGAITELPVLPQVYQSLRTALSKAEINISEIADLVEQDVGIAAKILQLVNSSYFGIRREVADLRQATTYLGINTIRDLVLSFGTFQQFESGELPPGFSLQREQRRAMLTARVAKKLLQDKSASEHAFLAGMLLDIGRLILATRMRAAFLPVLAECKGGTVPSHRLEREMLGIGHGEVGAYLLGLWGMAYPIVEAVAHHHDPARVAEQTEFGVLGAVHVADALAQEQDCHTAGEIDEDYLDRLGVRSRLPEWRELAAHEAEVQHAMH